MKQLGRREFLRAASFAGAALAVPHRSASGSPPRPGGPAKRVLIIGAGLAGLVAGYELKEAGYDVTIVEARSRPGGRVLTLRGAFDDGLYAEAGALFIPNNHDFTLKYARKFDLPLAAISPRAFAEMFYLRGQRVIPKDGEPEQWPLDLTAEERALGHRGMWQRYIGDFLREMAPKGSVTSSSWPPDSLKPLDQITFAQFLRRQGASPDAVALLRLGYLDLFGDGIDASSALAILRDSALRLTEQRDYSIRGGNDQLPKAFATRLQDKIRFGSPVIEIEHDGDGVHVVHKAASGTTRLAGDHLICAIPFSTLRRIEVTPPFSESKRKAISELPYTSVSRVFLQSRHKFWRDEGLPGAVNTEPPLMWIWEPTYNQTGERGILESYAAGAAARKTASLPEEQRIQSTLAAMDKVYPGLRANYERGVTKCWDEDEWSRGDYAWFKPGQVTTVMPHIARAEGRVHFAGEHASAWPGWMQGALESGVRAAKEISDPP